jgi:hypothetical protein
MFNTQNGASSSLPALALPDLLAGGDIQPPAPWIIPRTCSAVRFNTLVLLAVAIARVHGIGSPQWVRFGALVANEIGPRVWGVKEAAMNAIEARG